MEFKYILNENTFKALQDISSPEERWNISYRSFKGLYPNINLTRIETRDDMKLKWIISDIFEADRFDFIYALEKIDYEGKTIFLKAYCMPNSWKYFDISESTKYNILR